MIVRRTFVDWPRMTELVPHHRRRATALAARRPRVDVPNDAIATFDERARAEPWWRRVRCYLDLLFV
jgi:hypothetical protein